MIFELVYFFIPWPLGPGIPFVFPFGLGVRRQSCVVLYPGLADWDLGELHTLRIDMACRPRAASMLSGPGWTVTSSRILLLMIRHWPIHRHKWYTFSFVRTCRGIMCKHGITGPSGDLKLCMNMYRLRLCWVDYHYGSSLLRDVETL